MKENKNNNVILDLTYPKQPGEQNSNYEFRKSKVYMKVKLNSKLSNYNYPVILDIVIVKLKS